MAQRLRSPSSSVVRAPAPGTPRLLTVGQIAERLGCATHQVSYFVTTRGVPAAGVAGRYRLFDQAAVDLISRGIRGRGCVEPAPAADVATSAAASEEREVSHD